jgi:uncharacterized Fe-S cluster-containing MiaB family protein
MQRSTGLEFAYSATNYVQSCLWSRKKVLTNGMNFCEDFVYYPILVKNTKFSQNYALHTPALQPALYSTNAFAILTNSSMWCVL